MRGVPAAARVVLALASAAVLVLAVRAGLRAWLGPVDGGHPSLVLGAASLVAAASFVVARLLRRAGSS